MNKSNISWEIVLAGLAFIGIGIYLFNKASSAEHSADSAVIWHAAPEPPTPPMEPSLPGAIVIDLENLESLKNLENLKNLRNLENLKQLEIELKNIDKVIDKHTHDGVQESLDQSLKKLETELQQIEGVDYKVKLQNQKLYINKNYNINEAQWTKVKSGVYVFRESFGIPNMKSMDLKLGFGNLNIVGSDQQGGEITLRATGSIEDPADLTRQLNIQTQLMNSNAQFHVNSASGSDISNRINLEATLTIPRNVQLTANTSGGHINVNNLSNNQNIHTSGGHISLYNVEGETVAKTSGGHITCDKVAGKTTLSTSGGHIKVNKSQGSLVTKTGGGHIEIQDASGSVIAKTSGGNISASIKEAKGHLKFFTSAGNISLFLQPNITANVNASGSSVNLAEVFNFDGTKTRGHISGAINGGGMPMVVHCGYGNVNINAH